MLDLTLLIPGLLGPQTNYPDDFAPRLDALELILARADHQPDLPDSLYRILCDLSGIEADPGRDLPVAALTRLFDDNQPPKSFWLRADPVHLRADRDGLVLMDSFVLGLNRHDALAIAAEVNRVLENHGWTLEVPHEDRWYIQMDEMPDLVTSELPTVVGRDIRRLLPQGGDAIRFHSLLNEIQMQLYNCDLNRLRESRGELPVNSIWLWGLGALPDDFEWEWTAVFSEDKFVQGMATITGTPCAGVPADLHGVLEQCGPKDSALVMLQHCQAPAQYQNMMLWHQALELLEQAWFKPALGLLRKRKLRSLRVITEGHCFNSSWLGIRRFWRRPVPPGNWRGA